MWFAALGRIEGNPWVARLLARILEGSPEVLALLEGNPFEERPPQRVRAMLYDYRFAEDRWWSRQLLGPYTPELRLSRERPGALQVAPPAP
jgi:hypothetical protein